MNSKPTLIILAAGIGSRYGSLKQLDAFTSYGETIIDFSIFDALRAGFGKFVFIIRKSTEKEFRAIFDEKLNGKALVNYVFQEVENIPDKYKNLERKKPWGTGHALLMAKEVVKENFAVINADDFYGKEAFEMMAIKLSKTNVESYNFSMISYVLKNTTSEYGFVSRGKCSVNNKSVLTAIKELTHIEKINGQLMCKNEFDELNSIDENTIVSMNFWGFTPKYFEFSDALFENFLNENASDLKAEFYIPMIINEVIASKNASVNVLMSNSKWFGVTYKQDKELVQKEIKKLINKGIYPSKLWKKND